MLHLDKHGQLTVFSSSFTHCLIFNPRSSHGSLSPLGPTLFFPSSFHLVVEEVDTESIRNKNLERSRLLQCPPEIWQLIAYWVADAVDILSMTHTCSALLRNTITNQGWFYLYKRRFPQWASEACIDDEPFHTSGWKRVLLPDAQMRRRLGAPLPPMISPPVINSHIPAPLVTMPPFETASQEPTISLANLNIDSKMVNKTKVTLESQNAKNENEEPVFIHERDQKNLRVLLDNATYHPLGSQTYHEGWTRMSSPEFSVDAQTKSTLLASMIAKQNLSRLEPHLKPCEFQILLNVLPDLSRPIAVIKSDAWKNDQHSIRGHKWHHPFEAQNLSAVQLVGVKHFPVLVTRESTSTALTEIRIVIALAFGERVSEEEIAVLDVWRMLKVMELWLPIGSLFQSAAVHVESLETPRVGQVETIIIDTVDRVRPRLVKICSIENPWVALTAPPYPFHYTDVEPTFSDSNISSSSPNVTGARILKRVEYIVIFGILNSDDSSAVVRRKILFTPNENWQDSWPYRVIARGIACMSFFPSQSGYEHLLVLFNRCGRGMIWNWVQGIAVAQLNMPEDMSPKNENLLADPSTTLIYWGVQVSFMETPRDIYTIDRRKRSFSVVALADDAPNGWESCWWYIDSHFLESVDLDITNPNLFASQTISSSGELSYPSSKKAENLEQKIIFAKGRRSETQTLGVEWISRKQTRSKGLTLDGPLLIEGSPVRFVAYVVWNRYRICLTSDGGILMVDLEEKSSQSGLSASQSTGATIETSSISASSSIPSLGTPDREWVTYTENEAETSGMECLQKGTENRQENHNNNPVIDILIVHNSLVITRKIDICVWPFVF